MRFAYQTIVTFCSLRTSQIFSSLPSVVILLPLILGDNEPKLWYQCVTGNRLIRLVRPLYGTIRAISVRDTAYVLVSSVYSFRRECFSSETNKNSTIKQFIMIEIMDMINSIYHNVNASKKTWRYTYNYISICSNSSKNDIFTSS